MHVGGYKGQSENSRKIRSLPEYLELARGLYTFLNFPFSFSMIRLTEGKGGDMEYSD